MPASSVPATAARLRAPRPDRLPPMRALAGAAVAVAGVLLGIGTLLWATDAPAVQGDPVVHRPVGGAVAPSTPPGTSAATMAAPPALDLPAPPSPSAPPPAAAAPPAPPATPAREPILVINNSRIPDLAQRAARRFTAGGWPVKGIDGVTGRIRQTTVYYPPGLEQQAQEFARLFGIPRVLPRLPQLRGSGLTVVVTRDYTP